MEWLMKHLEVVLMVGLLVWWLSQTMGPSLAAKWPTIRQKLTGKNLALPLIAGLLAMKHFSPSVLPAVDPVPARSPDLVDRCGVSGRALLADAVTDFSRKSFANDQEREDAVNEKIHDVIEASFEPVNVAIAKAIKSDRVTECADAIRKGELRE